MQHACPAAAYPTRFIPDALGASPWPCTMLQAICWLTSPAHQRFGMLATAMRHCYMSPRHLLALQRLRIGQQWLTMLMQSAACPNRLHHQHPIIISSMICMQASHQRQAAMQHCTDACMCPAQAARRTLAARSICSRGLHNGTVALPGGGLAPTTYQYHPVASTHALSATSQPPAHLSTHPPDHQPAPPVPHPAGTCLGRALPHPPQQQPGPCTLFLIVIIVR